MTSEIPGFATGLRDLVFAKTPMGRSEVAQRGAGLNGRQRSILIVLDGQKPLGAIGTLLPQQELARILTVLLELGLIAPVADEAPSLPAGRTAAAASAPSVDSARLVRIKAMMTRSAETYLGVMASEVVRRVEQASDETQLLSVLGHWHMAMRESKYGRDVAGVHLEQIKASFRGEETIAEA
jgi:hypothetical protein